MHSIGAQKAKYRTPLRLIKSVQEVEFTIASASTSTAVTLPTSVDKSKTLILWLGTRTPTNCADRSQIDCRVELTNNNTATAYVNSVSAVGAARIPRALLVEFYSHAILNIDHGTILIASGTTSNSANRTVNLPDLSNSFIAYCGGTTDATGDGRRINTGFADLALAAASPATITATKGTTTGNLTVGYCSVTFNPGILKSRQESFLTISSGTTATASISAVSLTDTLLIWSGSNYSDGFTTYELFGYQSSATQLTVTRNISTSVVGKMRFTILEFDPKWVATGKQAAQPTYTTLVATVDTPIAPVNLSKTILSYLNHTTINSFSNIEYTMSTIGTTSNANIRATRANAADSGNVPTVSFEIFEFV